MVKITGLDQLTKQIDQAQVALAALDGELGTVHFDPNDPESIEAAILQCEMAVDERVGAYASNPFVAPLIEQAKEHFREAIISKAAAARLGDADDA